MSAYSSNIYALLDDDQPSTNTKQNDKKQAPAKKEQPKQEQKPQQQHHERVVVQDRDRRGGREGARFGGRGRGGRGRGRGRGGRPTDGSVRQFDRRGAPRGRAPGQPARQGHALGPEGGIEFEPESDAVEIAAAPDGVVEEVVDIEPVEIEEADTSLTYDEYLAQKAAKLVVDEVKIREPQNDAKQWQPVKELKKASTEETDAPAQRKETNNKKKNIVSLDEFVGGTPAPRTRYEGRGGYRGRGGRGGRGGARVNVFDESAFPKLG